jgi:hypothetical protein
MIPRFKMLKNNILIERMSHSGGNSLLTKMEERGCLIF